MDNYWIGEIKGIRKSGLHGPAGVDQFLVEVLWLYTKDQILAENGHGDEVKRWEHVYSRCVC